MDGMIFELLEVANMEVKVSYILVPNLNQKWKNLKFELNETNQRKTNPKLQYDVVWPEILNLSKITHLSVLTRWERN